jgi:hypothetical protein
LNRERGHVSHGHHGARHRGGIHGVDRIGGHRGGGGVQRRASRDSFVSLVRAELRRFGIRLTVTPDGTIQGRAFGTPVTGRWNWNNGYFCRDLFYGEDDLGFNCQLVQVNGETLRFTSDQGQGIYADLTLR